MLSSVSLIRGRALSTGITMLIFAMIALSKITVWAPPGRIAGGERPPDNQPSLLRPETIAPPSHAALGARGIVKTRKGGRGVNRSAGSQMCRVVRTAKLVSRVAVRLTGACIKGTGMSARRFRNVTFALAAIVLGGGMMLAGAAAQAP